MENKMQGFGSSSSSSSSLTSTSLDHIFGSKDSTTSPPSSGGAFASIFPPPSTVLGRNASPREAFIGSSRFPDDAGNFKYGNPGNGIEVKGATGKGKSNKYQNEIGEPCYLSSSIYYGGQENYSPRTNGNADSQHTFKKDDNIESNGNNPESASRGNWWQGSLYY